MENDHDNRPPRVAAYLALLGVQIIGALLFIWKELPSFNQLLRNPGAQIPFIPYDDLTTIGILLVMQVAYWYRLRRIPIPFQGPNQIQSHLFLFLGRISFIFGSALFSVVFFRHRLRSSVWPWNLRDWDMRSKPTVGQSRAALGPANS
jgi:hypothetical protein